MFFLESWQKVEGTIWIRMGDKRRSNGGMFKHTKSKKASNGQLEFQTQPATDGRHLFFFFFSRTEEEAATTGGARLTLIPSFWGEGARDARSSDAANPARAPAALTVAPTQGHVAHPGTGTQATTRSPSVQHPFFLFFF